MLRYLERLHDVNGVAQLGEVVAAKRIPVAVTVSPAQVFRHLRQITDVGRRGLHKRRVVLDRRRDEQIVVRIFIFLGVVAVGDILLIDEQPLHPPVADAAGVASDVKPLGYVVDATEQTAEELKRAERELRRLVHENPVVFLTVVLLLGVVARPVAEVNQAAVGKVYRVQRAVVARYPRYNHLYHRLDVVRLQFRISLTHYQDADARIVISAEHGLDPDCPRLAAALRPAVAGIELAGSKELLLLRVRLTGVPDVFCFCPGYLRHVASYSVAVKCFLPLVKCITGCRFPAGLKPPASA